MSQSPSPSVPASHGFTHRTRGEALERGFLSCLELIERHQEKLLPPGFISDYEALGWIVVKDGIHQVTSAGMTVVQAMKTQQRQRRKKASPP